MRALRRIAIVLLSCLGIVLAAAAVLWGGSLAGLARGEVVATSALGPDYTAGDLVVVTRSSTEALRAGDVVSVRSQAGSGTLLERVVAVEPADDGWSVTSAASAAAEPSTRTLGDEAWTPSLRVPVLGGVVAAAVEPAVLIPTIAIVLLLAAVVLIGRAPAARVSAAAG